MSSPRASLQHSHTDGVTSSVSRGTAIYSNPRFGTLPYAPWHGYFGPGTPQTLEIRRFLELLAIGLPFSSNFKNNSLGDVISII